MKHIKLNKDAFVKALAYRLVAMVATTILAIVIMTDWKIGITVGVLDFILKVFLYYVFECIWSEVIFSSNNKGCI